MAKKIIDQPIEAPEHWSDLRPEVRKALIEQAEDRIFWKGVFSRLGFLSKLAQILLVIGGFVAVLRSGAADWLLGVKK